MKTRRSTAAVQNVVSLFILFVVGPALGVLCIVGGLGIAYRLFQADHFNFAAAATALALLLIGAGLLQFAYLLRFKPGASLSTGVIYLASTAFVAIGAVCIVIWFFGGRKLDTFRGISASVGMIGIGFMGFRFALARTKQNQLPDPTSPSVTPSARAGGAPSVAADH